MKLLIPVINKQVPVKKMTVKTVKSPFSMYFYLSVILSGMLTANTFFYSNDLGNRYRGEEGDEWKLGPLD